jgi:alpha-soluble NSF attachment protein
MLNLAINLFEDIGRLSMAAKHYKDIADIYEKEENVERAMEYYEKAAELYSGEGIDSTANQCKIKVAQFAAQLEQYNKAIAIYEDVAKQSMSNNLLKYSVKGYLLNAGLCQICGKDVVAINNALEKYQVCFYQSCLLDAFVYSAKGKKSKLQF